MVYKIRNKSIFWTRAGWKNNWHPKNFNAPRPSNGDNTMGIRCRYDHNSFLRACHSYRSLSRHCKQYFYGDKQLEEAFILGLRSFFIIPFISECHTDMIKHGGERRMVDQLDRDFELVSHNTHPFQLFTYNLNNRFIAQRTEEAEVAKKGGQTTEDQMMQYLDQVVKAEKAKLADGDKLSIDRVSEIILHVFRKARAEQQRPSQNNRGSDGNVNDFLEQRRPFLEPNPNANAH